jgi:hypothetical protein
MLRFFCCFAHALCLPRFDVNRSRECTSQNDDHNDRHSQDAAIRDDDGYDDILWRQHGWNCRQRGEIRRANGPPGHPEAEDGRSRAQATLWGQSSTGRRTSRDCSMGAISEVCQKLLGTDAPALMSSGLSHPVSVLRRLAHVRRFGRRLTYAHPSPPKAGE